MKTDATASPGIRLAVRKSQHRMHKALGSADAHQHGAAQNSARLRGKKTYENVAT